MKRILRLFLVPLVTLTFAGVSFAQATPATPATPASPAKKAEKQQKERPKAIRVTGQVVAVDAKAGTVTVKAKDKEVSLTADNKRAKGRLDKVKVGDTVTVSYIEKEGKLIARSVTAAREAAKGTEKKAETKGAEKKEGTKAATK